ncbi:LbtU family siderophore porin [soil metagenome]
MKRFQLTPIVTALCLMGAIPSLSFAAETSNAEIAQLLKKVNERTELLENEVKSLRTQVVTLKKQLRQTQTAPKRAHTHPVAEKEDFHDAPPASAPHPPLPPPPPGAVTNDLLRPLYANTPVFTSPYFGVNPQYDASELDVNLPGVNQELRLLQQRQVMENEFAKRGVHPPSVPVLILGGKIEAQALAIRSERRSSSDIDLANVELDAKALLNDWVMGYMSINYDNSYNNPVRISNSRLFVHRAFITVGNLNRSPLYATIGQISVPFGIYNSVMISAPLPQLLGRVTDRALELGYHPIGDNGFYGAIYTFRGDTRIGASDTNINNGGANLGYEFKRGEFSAEVGGGVIGNIADSEGMQSNGSTRPFTGFGETHDTERLHHRVPGGNLHAKMSYAPFFLITDYITSLKSFQRYDLSYNYKGAKPKAFYAEGIYVFNVFGKPGNLALGYGQSSQALALDLPKQRYLGAVNISLWGNTVESLEYHHDVNYSRCDFGSGANSIDFRGRGSNSDTITAQIGVYW